MRRFQTIQDRNDAEENCEHRIVVYLCLKCGGGLMKDCEYCGEEFPFEADEMDRLCDCKDPEWAEKEGT